jgi:hypothetical protein
MTLSEGGSITGYPGIVTLHTGAFEWSLEGRPGGAGMTAPFGAELQADIIARMVKQAQNQANGAKAIGDDGVTTASQWIIDHSPLNVNPSIDIGQAVADGIADFKIRPGRPQGATWTVTTWYFRYVVTSSKNDADGTEQTLAIPNN